MADEYSAHCVRAARRAAYAMFFADGIGFGVWAGHIPAFKQKFLLSDSSLSIVLLAVAVGAILSMPLAGQAVRPFGSRCSIVDRSLIAIWLGHESLDTTQIYLDANLAMKEQILEKTRPLKSSPGRYRPDDQLLSFLKAL